MKKNTLKRAFVLVLSLICAVSVVACDGEIDSEQTKNEDSTVLLESETESVSQTETVLGAVTVTEIETVAETEEETDATNLILGDDVEYADDFSVSKVFGDNMVLQRNEYIRVWGWADESQNGKKVSASFGESVADGLIENGAWEIVLKVRLEACAEKGNHLTVYTDSKESVYHDVLIGDVFMVIGQSNVQYSINDYLNAEPNLKWKTDELDPNSLIRINYNSNTDKEGYPVRGSADVCEDVVTDNGWVVPDADNVLRLSAVGYFIADQIVELTQNSIPVGIAQFSASGRPLSVFMPNELADQYGTDHFDEEKGIYIDNYYGHVETRYMYNHYIKPYEKMPIAGIVWYQGESESNIKLSAVFVERFTLLMNYMRSTHNLVNKEFPVFVVEFPSVYKVEGSDQYLDTGRSRAVEGTIPMNLPNSYVAVTSDLWNDKTNTNNIHPYCKYEIAERVSALIDAVIYEGRSIDEASGPVLESYEVSSDRKTIVLKFANCGDGLTTSDGGTAVTGMFQLSKKNMIEKRYAVVAEITAPDTVTVTCERAMTGVAYHAISEYFFGVDINLCDSDGTPAAAFWIFTP